MTARGRIGVPAAERADADVLAASVLRLVTGRGAPLCDDWARVHHAAVLERCASLAWLRSGAVIREQATSSVCAAWRQLAVSRHLVGQRQLAALLEAAAALERDGCEPVVLKGMPLSLSLHGDPFVRETVDADLLVAESRRTMAAATLASLGWRRWLGEAPWEETWTRGEGRAALYLDLHSTLLDHNLAHLGAPRVDTAPATIGGQALRVHAGPLLPAYLAAHVAKHRVPPLLWFVDLATLWSTYDASQRGVARDAARRARLEGYLAWGIARVEALPRACDGDRAALAMFGIAPEGRRDSHPATRDARLASSAGDSMRAIGAWVWPPPLRRHPGAFARRCVSRLIGLRNAAAGAPIERYER